MSDHELLPLLGILPGRPHWLFLHPILCYLQGAVARVLVWQKVELSTPRLDRPSQGMSGKVEADCNVHFHR